jgi:uracil-DNA glycosylase family 4
MVGGEGPRPALGMIVGEAPGFTEEKEGRPFVGKSGKLLDAALASLGVPRESVYITNVVKTVPVDEDGRIRKPTPDERKEWSGLLLSETWDVAPVAILALGRTASDDMTGYEGVPMGSKIGNVYTAYHPAYVLRGGMPQHEWLEQLTPWAEAVKNGAG